MNIEREIATALHNARAQGYDELRIDVKTQKITPIKRGVGQRVSRQQHVTITRIVEAKRYE